MFAYTSAPPAPGWGDDPEPIAEVHGCALHFYSVADSPPRAALCLRCQHQDVRLSYAKLKEAEIWVENYRNEIIPSLKRNLDDMDQLFQQGQAGVDILRLLDVRRKLLRAQDGYLDALLAYTTVLADLAQAVGDPSIAMKLPPSEKK